MIGRPNRGRLRIRTILLLVNLIILLLPLGGIYFLKIYEDELVHQTETELIAQGASIVASYSHIVEEIIRSGRHQGDYSVKRYGIIASLQPKGYYQYVPKRLEFSREKIYPPCPDALPLDISADAIALEAGKIITPILKKTKELTLAGIRILDYKGVIVATSGSEYGLSLNHIHEIKQALQGQPISLLRLRVSDTRSYSWTSTSRDTGLRVFVSLPIISNHRVIGAVFLSRTPRSIKKALYDKKERVLFAVVLLLLIIIILTLFTSLTISRPVEKLIKQTSLIANENKKEAPLLTRPITREFDLLSQAFSKMAERVEYRSEYIRNFAMQVSHEFKTPLTSIQGTIELLQNYLDKMTDDKRNRFFNNILQDTNRLKRLVSRLMELARADVFEPTEEISDILTILSQQTERYKDFGLKIKISCPETMVNVAMSRDVFETIVTNLFDNSYQHDATEVTVDIQKNDTVDLIISDDGKGISETNAVQIFTPFFTTNRTAGGTGLGLPIIQSLLLAHNGTIYFVPNKKGATFVLSLPKSE